MNQPPAEAFGIAEHSTLVRRIIRAYESPVARAYGRVRFTILNVNILAVLCLCLRGRPSVLDIGCGFGLLGCYLAHRFPNLAYTGLDLDAGRIQMAKRAAESLHLRNVRSECRDARELKLEQEFDAIVLVDCLHHLPDATKVELLRVCYQHLVGGGALVLKEVTRRPWPKLLFTWVLDVLVTRGFEMWYWSEDRFLAELSKVGYIPEIYPLTDWLPYPHILYLCRKP